MTSLNKKTITFYINQILIFSIPFFVTIRMIKTNIKRMDIMNAIEITNLTKNYGKFTAVNNISLKVKLKWTL